MTAARAFAARVRAQSTASRTVPGVETLEELDPELAWLPVSATARAPRTDTTLVLSRGFGGTNAALLVRAAAA